MTISKNNICTAGISSAVTLAAIFMVSKIKIRRARKASAKATPKEAE